MGQIISSLSFARSPANELGIVVYRAYQTKYSDLIVLRLQSGGDLLLAGNEVGTLLLYDISLDSESPRQILALSFEYSGISEICWLDGDTVAVGTTRGRIVIFTVKNELRRMTEKSSVKAHGDGAAQIAVESLDYCQRTRCLVSVAEGAGSVRLWDVSGEGESNYPSISDRAENYYRHTHCEGVTQADDSLLYTSLCRFLSGRLAAARRLHGTISYVVFSVDPLEIKAEFRLGQEDGCTNCTNHLGNALVLDSIDRLVAYSLRDGCAFYSLPNMTRSMDTEYVDDGNPYCNQGVVSLKNATYIASVSKHGVIRILRTRDGSRAGSLKIPGRRRQDIHAIHAASGNRPVLVAASTADVNGPCQLTVWRNKNDRQPKNGPSLGRHEHSTVGIALLCIGICLVFQMAVFLLPLGDMAIASKMKPRSTSMESLRDDGTSDSISELSATLPPATAITQPRPSIPSTQRTSTSPISGCQPLLPASSAAGLNSKNALCGSQIHDTTVFTTD